jgi:ATP-binding cassette, subfamily B, bacterial
VSSPPPHVARRSAWHFFRDFPHVLRFVRPYWQLALASVAMIGVGTFVALLAPWPLAILIDTVLGDKPLPSFLGPLHGIDTTVMLVIAVLFGFLVTALEHAVAVGDNYVNTKLDQRMVLDFRSDLFRHAQGLSLAFHDQARTGNLMYQINNQASSLGAITVSIPPLAQSVLTLAGMFYVTFRIDPQLALLSLTIVPFVYYSAAYYAKRIEPRLYQVRSMEGESLSIVHEAMSMLRVIVAFGRESHEYGRFREQAESTVDARVKLTVRQTLFSLAVSLITAAGTALVLGVGAWHVLQGQLTVGELLVVMGYIAAVYQPLEQISHTLGSLQEQFIGLRGALDLLEIKPEVTEHPEAVTLRNVRGEVVFDSVCFSYPERPEALKGVSFRAEAGQRIAIVGATGAGKSTLVSLVSRFYDPQQGAVRLDGIDIRQVTLKSLRDLVSIVLQEPLLFSGSILENIRYGRLGASRSEVEEAAQAANAHDFILRLPDGYETVLGERGSRISGGERQRICVARAFLKDAPILILDEPTSSVDSKTEAVILEALERLMLGRTSFLIAHRLSTVRNADLIVVLSHGEVAEIGEHDELLSRDGLYRQLYEVQMGSAPPLRETSFELAAGGTRS